MGEDPEAFGVQRVFFDAVVVVEPGLGPPADMEGTEAVVAAPVQNAGQLLPVAHRFEGQVLHRGPGDDDAVKFLVRHLGEGHVEPVQVFGGGVPSLVAFHPHQHHLRLQGRIAQHPQKLGFGGFLGGHQIQNGNPQGPDILMGRPELRHGEDVLRGQDPGSGQIVGNDDGHGDSFQ